MTTGRINQVAVRNVKKVIPHPVRVVGPVFKRVGNRLGSKQVARDIGPSDNRQDFPSGLVFSYFGVENSLSRSTEPDT